MTKQEKSAYMKEYHKKRKKAKYMKEYHLKKKRINSNLLKVQNVNHLDIKNGSILERASNIIYERGEEKTRQYGDFKVGMRNTSVLASIMCGKDITPQDVTKILIALKLSRESHCHKEDNLLDATAYIAILNELETN